MVYLNSQYNVFLKLNQIIATIHENNTWHGAPASPEKYCWSNQFGSNIWQWFKPNQFASHHTLLRHVQGSFLKGINVNIIITLIKVWIIMKSNLLHITIVKWNQLITHCLGMPSQSLLKEINVTIIFPIVKVQI